MVLLNFLMVFELQFKRFQTIVSITDPLSMMITIPSVVLRKRFVARRIILASVVNVETVSSRRWLTWTSLVASIIA